MEASYILPIRRSTVESIDELSAYLGGIAEHVDVIVVDGSPPDVFAAHHAAWGNIAMHISPDPDHVTPNRKVGGVLTGVRHARHERLVIADDDVRYDADTLGRLLTILDEAHVVRPQNYFDPLPWHALWDTGRTLLNRMTGGDWPGTLGVRRSGLLTTGGYDGRVLFENLELVRTIQAAGGIERVPLDLFVRRIPPTSQHFWSQRVRQAYDEFARPLRLGFSLGVLPVTIGLALRRQWAALVALLLTIVGVAEAGRHRSGGTRVFPIVASLFAPAWVLERAVCSWLAVGLRIIKGGVPYRDTVLTVAATPMRTLRKRYADVHLTLESYLATIVPVRDAASIRSDAHGLEARTAALEAEAV